MKKTGKRLVSFQTVPIKFYIIVKNRFVLLSNRGSISTNVMSILIGHRGC